MGKVGTEVRRLEGGGGDETGVGGVLLEGEEDMECKSREEIVEKVRKSRIVRRGGRVSNIIKTYSIMSYFPKYGEGMENGHHLAKLKLCGSG